MFKGTGSTQLGADRTRRSLAKRPRKPELIHIGSREILRDDATVIVERIKAAGGNAEFKVWDGTVHSR
ncbi:alpha/beta hydrolase fold domain-containing protein [Pelagibacterium halotolerans]